MPMGNCKRLPGIRTESQTAGTISTRYPGWAVLKGQSRSRYVKSICSDRSRTRLLQRHPHTRAGVGYRLQHNYDYDLPTMKPDISSLSCGDVACAGGSNCRCDSVLGGGLGAHPQVRTGRSFRLWSACQPLGRSIGVVRRLALALAHLPGNVGLHPEGCRLNHEWPYLDSCIVLDMYTLHHDQLPLQQRTVNILVPLRSGLLWVTPANTASLI
ncbi:hypothetical protein C8F01DRAFT_1157839 [Mycena amicta]|nr:hypothetical protein C8F01DRAFT_1157839 [Mycena amicta]